jgi:hypothetical protein
MLGRWCEMKRNVQRALIEVGFIVFLFYTNLLMGEFARSGKGWTMGLKWALLDVVTFTNLLIAVLAALAGYVVLEFLRKRF